MARASRSRGLAALDGVDDVPWGELEMAGGSAADIPRALRALVTGDDDEINTALEDLQSLCHQWTVWSASAYAVPFLARLAAAGISSVELLDLLATIARSDDEWRHDGRPVADPGDAARRAIAAQAGVLAPLLDSPDAMVRMTAARALAQCRDASQSFPRLFSRWDREKSPSVRCTLLQGMSVLDPARTAGLASEVAGFIDAAERLVAAWACVTGGMVWSPELRAAGTAWLSEGLELAQGWWEEPYPGVEAPFAGLLCALADRGDAHIAVGLAVDALASATDARGREAALDGANDLAQRYRIPIPELAAALTRLAAGPATNPEARSSAEHLLKKLGPEPPAAGHVSAANDARGPGSPAGPASPADMAAPDLEALRSKASAGTPRSGRLSAAIQLRELTGDDAPLLAAIRDGLTLNRHDLQAAARVAATLPRPLPDWLIPAMESAMAAARQARNDGITPIVVAQALWELTGDATTVLPVITEGLRVKHKRYPQPQGGMYALDAARSMGPAGRPLVPALLPLLDSHYCPAAIRTLLRVDPEAMGGVPAASLADRLVAAAGNGGSSPRQAIAVLRELVAGDHVALSPEMRTRLTDAAERPRRVIQGGALHLVIRHDEELRAAIGELLDAVR
jgi:hypothetical protein